MKYYAEKANTFLNRKSISGFTYQQNLLLSSITLIIISCTIIYTSKRPTKIETKSIENDTNKDKKKRLMGTIISGIASLLYLSFILLFALSHTKNKSIDKDLPFIIIFFVKTIFLLLIWIFVYIIPIINYYKYGWYPLLDFPPKNTIEYTGYQIIRIYLGIIFIGIALYCTYVISYNTKESDTLNNNFLIAYVSVLMGGYAAVINLLNLVGLTSVDDVLLST